jgi:hypothetical protein
MNSINGVFDWKVKECVCGHSSSRLLFWQNVADEVEELLWIVQVAGLDSALEYGEDSDGVASNNDIKPTITVS